MPQTPQPLYINEDQARFILLSARAERQRAARTYVGLIDSSQEEQAKQVLDEMIQWTGMIDVLQNMIEDFSS